MGCSMYEPSIQRGNGDWREGSGDNWSIGGTEALGVLDPRKNTECGEKGAWD